MQSSWKKLLSVVSLVLPVASGLNACLDPDNADEWYRCTPGNTYRNFDDCGLTDEDFDDLGACFDLIDRSSIAVISMQNNMFTTFPPGIFTGITGISRLRVNGTPLTALTAGAFSDLSSMTYLRIGNSDLMTTLPAGLFDGLDALDYLRISSTKISRFPDGLFSGMPALSSLVLGSNDVTTIQNGLFADLTGLSSLSLNFYQVLTTLEDLIFADLPQLEELYLSYSGLSTLPEGLFSSNPSLRTLYLNNNAITTLPNGIFSGLTALQQLDLSGNPDLQCLPTTSATTVELDYTSGANNGGTCECTPIDAVTCDVGLTCLPGTTGYTCSNGVSTPLPSPAPTTGGTTNGPTVPTGTPVPTPINSMGGPTFLPATPVPTPVNSMGGPTFPPATPVPTPINSVSGPTFPPATPPPTTGGLTYAREKTTVTTWATAYDEKTLATGGCDPSGCAADLTRDSDLSPSSRWSCKYSLENAACEIWYSFEDPQDIVRLEMSFYKGDERMRSFSVTTFNDNGDSSFNYEFTSNGVTLGYEEFELDSIGVHELYITPIDPNYYDWFSVTETRFAVV